jgi:hypothetical protein
MQCNYFTNHYQYNFWKRKDSRNLFDSRISAELDTCVDSITIKRDHIRLLLPLILDYIILAKPDWEQKQREFATSLKFKDDDNKNKVLVDVGANIGIYTLIFASRYPSKDNIH